MVARFSVRRSLATWLAVLVIIVVLILHLSQPQVDRPDPVVSIFSSNSRLSDLLFSKRELVLPSTAELPTILAERCERVGFDASKVNKLEWACYVLDSLVKTMENVAHDDTRRREFSSIAQDSMGTALHYINLLEWFAVPRSYCQALRAAATNIQGLNTDDDAVLSATASLKLLKIVHYLMAQVLQHARDGDDLIIMEERTNKMTTELHASLPKELGKAAAAIGGGAMVALLAAHAALPILGFGTAGVVGGSFAAGVMGSAVASGSWFALMQSAGVIGFGALASGGILLAGAAVGGAVYGISKLAEQEAAPSVTAADLNPAPLRTPPSLLPPST